VGNGFGGLSEKSLDKVDLHEDVAKMRENLVRWLVDDMLVDEVSPVGISRSSVRALTTRRIGLIQY
jgi:hypothetical protein